MKIEIFGKEIKDEMDFHRQFNKYADCSFYGHNLDALWDVLTGMLDMPVHLIWYDSDISAKILERYKMIIEILERTRIFFEEICKNNPQYPSDKKFTYELR